MTTPQTKPRGDDIFLSLVGQQPSATAVLLKSWIAANPAPARILLLATPSVRHKIQTERLLEFCKNTAQGADCKIVPIAPGLKDTPDLPSARTWVRQFLQEQNKTVQVIFAADPGPNFLVAAVARILPPETTFLHADSHHGWAYARWEDKLSGGKLRRLQDLDWDTLFNLYDLKAQESGEPLHSLLKEVLLKRRITIATNIRRSVVFPDLPDASSLPRLELAFEARGRLYGLCVADGQDILEQIRKIERLSLSLKNLNPHISVYTRDRNQRRRIRAEGLEVLTDETLKKWVSSCEAPPPGQAVEADTGWGDQLPNFERGSGEGKDTTPLLVWMSADPSSTLTSIWTHRPEELVLLYDRTAPVVVEKVKRLLDCSNKIPVNTIHLWPSDYLGGLVSRRIQQNFPEAKADVSPGTKAQAVTFARLPGLKLWSLHPPNAVALDGQASIPLQYPDLLTLSRIQSGILHGHGSDAKQWGEKKVRFLQLLGRAITEMPPDLSLDPLEAFDQANASLNCDSNGKWHVRVDNQRASGTVPPKGGGWLEQVVAAAFVNAGAEEVYLNLKWAWPPGVRVPRNGPRAELDIAARIGPSIFAVSCKLRAQNLSVRKQAAEVEAMARIHFGRFAIPVAVRVRLAPTSPPEKGAVCFDLKTVVSDNFRQKLDEAVRARRTLEN